MEKEKEIAQECKVDKDKTPAHSLHKEMPNLQGSAQREGENLNKDMIDYVQLIRIICFCILRFPSGVCYWMAVLAQGRSQESEWFSREYRVAILFPWSPSEGHYLAG